MISYEKFSKNSENLLFNEGAYDVFLYLCEPENIVKMVISSELWSPNFIKVGRIG